MATQRNWNPQIGPAVAHITDTQWRVPLAMREIDPPMLQARMPLMPRGMGVTATPHGYAPGQDPISFFRGGGRGKQQQRANGRRDAAGGPVVINTAPIGETFNTTNVYNEAEPGQPGNITDADRRHNLTNVRPVMDSTATELPGIRALNPAPIRALGTPRYRLPRGVPTIGTNLPF